MSLGRTSTFLDIYAERDLQNGDITEQEVQEIIDHFIMKYVSLNSHVRLNIMNYSLEIQLG